MVTESTLTVIDSIFRDNLHDDVISGNILLTQSEHFCQFVNREQININIINVYQRDYSKLSSESFCDEVSIQNCTCRCVHDSFKYFYTKPEGSVSRHVPLEKSLPMK